VQIPLISITHDFGVNPASRAADSIMEAACVEEVSHGTATVADHKHDQIARCMGAQAAEISVRLSMRWTKPLPDRNFNAR
jgi:hypothetical protein